MLNLHFFNLLLVSEQGPEQVNDLNGLVLVGLLFVGEHFVDEVKESFKEF